MQYILRRAARHEGTAFVEVLQNCAVYNPNAYAHLTDRASKDDHVLYLEHAKPMVFGKNKEKGLRLQRGRLQVVNVSEVSSEQLIVLDESDPDPTMAFRLAHMQYPEFPVPIGVFLEHERPTYEGMLMDQINAAREQRGPGKLDKLFRAGDTWEVHAQEDDSKPAEKPDGNGKH
jgi:2-oxoglutarate ferredoxin oxidoreductase subunit beta